MQVLLLSGLLCDETVWWGIYPRLADLADVTPLHFAGYDSLTLMAESALAAVPGPVAVVGHSMGGLVARYYVQRMGGDARVHTLVTLGTPHEGSQLAHLLPLPLVRQLQPDSELIRELHEPAPGCRTRFLAIWSDLDQLVVPKRHATVVHDDLAARNVFVRGVGHMSLPVDGRVVHEICTTLAHLDSDGTTVAVGATSIASSAGKSPTEPPTQNKGLAQRRARR